MHNVENLNFVGVRQGKVKRENIMSGNVMMYPSEIGDASTWLKFKGTQRTPTITFVSIHSLCLPSFTSSQIIYEKKME